MDGKCLKNETMDCAADPLLLELQGVPRHLQAQSELWMGVAFPPSSQNMGRTSGNVYVGLPVEPSGVTRLPV